MSADAGVGAAAATPRFAHRPFRPLRPLTEGDRELFFGRADELAALLELLAGEAQGLLLLGEAGVGKTSLLRAGLVPELADRGAACAVVDGRELAFAEPTAPSAAAHLLVVDDAGAALDDGLGQVRLTRLLDEAWAVPGRKILLALDDADHWRLERIAGAVGRAFAAAPRLRLAGLDEARTSEVIERTVLGGGGYLESGVPQELARDLTHAGPVLPAALQLVAGEVLARALATRKAYARSGGPAVITWRFLERAATAAGGAAARRVVAALAAAPPHHAVSVDELARATGLGAAAVAARLAAWRHLGVAQAVGPADAPSARLATEWLRPLVRNFTGAESARGIATRLLLRRRVDGRGLLWPWELLAVQRHAGALDPAAGALVRRSQLVLGAVVAALVVGPLVGVALHRGAVGRARHLALVGEGPGARVVVRRGPPGARPSWIRRRPPLGAVVADSGFLRAALRDPGLPAAGPGGKEAWSAVVAALRPLPRGAVALVADGDARPLTVAFADPALRPTVVRLVGLAGRGQRDELALLTKAWADESAEVRRLALDAAVALEGRTPGAGAAFFRAALEDPDAAKRSAALAAIARLPDAAATALLVAQLDAPGDSGRAPAAVGLLAARAGRTPAAAQALGQALRGPARDAAAEALGRLLATPGPSVEPAERTLVALALDAAAPPEARLAALRLLRGRDVQGLETITGPPAVLAAALPLIARAQREGAAPRIAEALHGTVEQRAAAAAALAFLPPTAETRKQLKTLEHDPSAAVRAAAVAAMPVLGRAAAGPLARYVRVGDAATQRAAMNTLVAHLSGFGFGTVVGVLGAASRNGSPAIRVAAVKGLAAIAPQNPRVTAAWLRGALQAKSPGVRAEVAVALGVTLAHGARGVTQLLRRLATDDDPATRREAARALARATPPLVPSALQALGAFVNDRDAAVRAAVATSLGALAPAQGPDAAALATLLRDHDPRVAAAARAAVQGRGAAAPDLDGVLTAELAGAPPATRIDLARTAGAAHALGALRLALADADVTVRRAAAGGLAALDGAAVPLASAALADSDPQVRTAAVEALVRLKAAAPLARAARSADPAVRRAALQALPRLGADAARPTLEAALGDASEATRAAAVRGLGLLGCAAAARLRGALGDPATDVRLAAAAAVGQARCDASLAAVVASLRDPTDADARFAAGFDLAGRAAAPDGAAARQALDGEATRGTPPARLTAQVARAFVGRPAEMARFVKLLRTGD